MSSIHSFSRGESIGTSFTILANKWKSKARACLLWISGPLELNRHFRRKSIGGSNNLENRRRNDSDTMERSPFHWPRKHVLNLFNFSVIAKFSTFQDILLAYK